jgi:hypothetical protein
MEVVMEKEIRPRLTEAEYKVIQAMQGDRIIKSYIGFGCPHVPFHNKKLMQGALDLMSCYHFDGIFLGGDFLDMASLSDYEKGKLSNTGVTLEDEYQAGNLLLDEFDKRLDPGALKVYLWGNHEDRYWRWRADVNNSKLGNVLNPTTQLFLEKRGYIVKDQWKKDFYKLGSLYVTHGEYYNIHAAKKHLDVFRRNIIFFHTHRAQMHREGDFCAWNCATMADIDAPCFDYAKRGQIIQWANGFPIIHIDEGRRHFVEQINCINNSFVYNGVKYGG